MHAFVHSNETGPHTGEPKRQFTSVPYLTEACGWQGEFLYLSDSHPCLLCLRSSTPGTTQAHTTITPLFSFPGVKASMASTASIGPSRDCDGRYLRFVFWGLRLACQVARVVCWCDIDDPVRSRMAHGLVDAWGLYQKYASNQSSDERRVEAAVRHSQSGPLKPGWRHGSRSVPAGLSVCRLGICIKLEAQLPAEDSGRALIWQGGPSGAVRRWIAARRNREVICRQHMGLGCQSVSQSVNQSVSQCVSGGTYGGRLFLISMLNQA